MKARSLIFIIKDRTPITETFRSPLSCEIGLMMKTAVSGSSIIRVKGLQMQENGKIVYCRDSQRNTALLRFAIPSLEIFFKVAKDLFYQFYFQ